MVENSLCDGPQSLLYVRIDIQKLIFREERAFAIATSIHKSMIPQNKKITFINCNIHMLSYLTVLPIILYIIQ